MNSCPGRWFLALLLVVALSRSATVHADDGDIVPYRRGFTLQLVTWDSSTGLLRGSNAAGTMGIYIQEDSRPHPTRCGRCHASTTVPGAEDWNAEIRNNTERPVRWGDPSTSPFSSLLGDFVSQTGHVKVRLNRDLSTVRTLRPVPAPRP